jgi:membrane associated rhomboid family serine protease
MEEEKATGESRDPGAARADDLTRYSLEELNKLRDNLLAELERRSSAASPAEPVRFTARAGLRGWLEAKSRRLPLYGEGFVEIRPQEVVLGGWQRNWLGVAHRSETFIPLPDISDVIQERDWVRFQYEGTFGRQRLVEFQASSSERATTLAEALPKARSVDFERWLAVREFDGRLREAGGTPWITPTIVFANLLVFAATALSLKSLNLGAAPQMIGWGANFPPLTLHGQWWRLLSALFLHGSLAHVGFNMWALWNVGRLTERLYGNWAYAFLYFGCGVLAGLASIVWDPGRATLGASGAIFGIFAACILFALRPRSRVAVKVPVALWLSTLLFALYNLIAGFYAPGIDNAAHVGGVLAGLGLGACLARPLILEVRRRFPGKTLAMATALTAAGVLAALWQATGLGAQLTGPERFLHTHQWYVNGEAQNLRTWYEIAVAAGSGKLSDVTLGERAERELIPFWDDASTRLKKEQSSLPADEQQYGSLAVEYARLRLAWARALVDLAAGNSDRAADVAQFEKDSTLVAARAARLTLLASLEHRPRALVNNPWITAVTGWFTARHWKCVEPPAYLGEPPPSPTDSPTDGPAVRHAAGCRAQMLFMSADYATLDHWMAQAVTSIGDLPDGSSTFEGIVGGLIDLFNYGSLEMPQAMGRTTDWQRRVPNSIYPPLLQSLVFDSWAWAVRGHGTANTISPEVWSIFEQRVEMSAMGLREIVARANTNPLWYQLSLNVGLDQSQPLEDLRSIFKRGITEEPDYFPLYRSMLRILMPRWHGSYEDVHRFIAETSASPMFVGQKDYARYARLYWAYSSLEYDEAPLFDGPLAVWSTMKEGLEDLRKQHPASDLILNASAKFACMANDAASYREARPRLKGRLASHAWSQKVSLKLCDERFPDTAK